MRLDPITVLLVTGVRCKLEAKRDQRDSKVKRVTKVEKIIPN